MYNALTTAGIMRDGRGWLVTDGVHVSIVGDRVYINNKSHDLSRVIVEPAKSRVTVLEPYGTYWTVSW